MTRRDRSLTHLLGNPPDATMDESNETTTQDTRSPALKELDALLEEAYQADPSGRAASIALRAWAAGAGWGMQKAKAEAKRVAKRVAMRAKRIEASRCHRAGLATWRASRQTGAAA